jgi:protein-disulfide isomerase
VTAGCTRQQRSGTMTSGSDPQRPPQDHVETVIADRQEVDRMSRKSKRNRTTEQAAAAATAAAAPGRRRVVAVVAAFALVAAVVAAVLVYSQGPSPVAGDSHWIAALESREAPTLGSPDARVHVVEFLDPACETCALFFPIVKELMAEHPGRIRL